MAFRSLAFVAYIACRISCPFSGAEPGDSQVMSDPDPNDPTLNFQPLPEPQGKQGEFTQAQMLVYVLADRAWQASRAADRMFDSGEDSGYFPP